LSRYAVPPKIIPDRGHLSENGSNSPNKDRRDVFQDNDSRSNLANGSGQMPPKARSITLNTSASPGETEILTGETSADEIDGSDGGKIES